jgi:hypothetical protein
MGRLGVGNFRDMTEARLVEMGQYGVKISLARRLFDFKRVATHANPGLNERAGQPWPHRALMIGAIALTDSAVIPTHIG